MSGLPPPPPPPPRFFPAASAISIPWPASPWSLEDQHSIPPPPGVSPVPSTSHTENFFTWSAAPGQTNSIPSVHAPALRAPLHRQHVVQATLVNANETSLSIGCAAGGMYQQHQAFSGQFSPTNGLEAPSFGYGLPNSVYSPQNFAYNRETRPWFSSSIPSARIPQQTSSDEAGSLHKTDVLKSTNIEKVDVKDLIPKLQTLISQANESVAKILNMVRMNPDSLPVAGLNPQAVRTTAGNISRLSVSENQNIHDTACQSTRMSDDLPVTGLEPQAVGSIGGNSANVSVSENQKIHHMASQRVQMSDDFAKANAIFKSILVALSKSRENPFYNDAPGVVQIPVLASSENYEDSKLPGFAVGEKWDELTPHGFEADRQAQEMLLPSQYWLITQEISEWKDLPSKVSSHQLKAMAGLSCIQKVELRNWLLLHSSLYSVTFSRCMADHIMMLVVLCLRAVHREATDLLSYNNDGRQVVCTALPQSASWLAMQLSSICDVTHSTKLVLDLYKHAIKMAAYYSARCVGRCHKGEPEKESITVHQNKNPGSALEKEACNSPCTSSQVSVIKSCQSSRVCDAVLHLEHLAAAILEIKAQATSLTCKASEFFIPSSEQRSAAHAMQTKKAAEMRATRLDYRAVLDHDGLMWQRPQNQDSKRNMTKEELLSEERDYKRRRMSYRGKKLQRTPVEVLRDIIEGHMEDIVAAGGIGCIGRRPQDVHLTESLNFPSALESSRDTSSRDAHASYCDDDRYPRSQSRKSFRTEKVERPRYDLGSHRAGSHSEQGSQERPDSKHQSTRDPGRWVGSHSEQSSQERPDRKHQSTRDPGRCAGKLHGDKHRSSKYHSRSCEYD